MSKTSPLTGERFSMFLSWLDPDEAIAAERYEVIRLRLIRLFSCRGCSNAEDLADRTFDRVLQKIDTVASGERFNPASYLYAVGLNIYREWSRERNRFTELDGDLGYSAPNPVPDDTTENCLEKCLEKISLGNRTLILDYYRGEKTEKILHRKQLARTAGVTLNALQVRVLRIRMVLKKCLDECLDSQRR